MKSCEEMVNSLLERREAYIIRQNKIKKTVFAAVSSAFCLCAAVLLGLAVKQGGRTEVLLPEKQEKPVIGGVNNCYEENKNTEPNKEANGEDAKENGEAQANNNSQDNEEENAEKPAGGDTEEEYINEEENGNANENGNGNAVGSVSPDDRIIVNLTDEIKPCKLNIIGLMCDDLIELNRDQAKEYYGVNIFPDIPGDLVETDETEFRIYKRNGGAGETYWDINPVSYFSGDYSRKVTVEAGKACYPLSDFLFYDSSKTKSVINGTEIAIEQADEYFLAQFIYKGTGFQITAKGLSQEEFISVLSSIVK